MILVILLSVFFSAVAVLLHKYKFLFIGRFYIAIRSNGVPNSSFIAKGIYRELFPPWRRGTGVEFRVSKYVLHVGLCKKSKAKSQDAGFLEALDGRWLDEDVDTIKGWN